MVDVRADQEQGRYILAADVAGYADGLLSVQLSASDPQRRISGPVLISDVGSQLAESLNQRSDRPFLHASVACEPVVSFPDAQVGCQKAHGCARSFYVDAIRQASQCLFQHTGIIAVGQLPHGSPVFTQGIQNQCPVADAFRGRQTDGGPDGCGCCNSVVHRQVLSEKKNVCPNKYKTFFSYSVPERSASFSKYRIMV